MHYHTWCCLNCIYLCSELIKPISARAFCDLLYRQPYGSLWFYKSLCINLLIISSMAHHDLQKNIWSALTPVPQIATKWPNRSPPLPHALWFWLISPTLLIPLFNLAWVYTHTCPIQSVLMSKLFWSSKCVLGLTPECILSWLYMFVNIGIQVKEIMKNQSNDPLTQEWDAKTGSGTHHPCGS